MTFLTEPAVDGLGVFTRQFCSEDFDKLLAYLPDCGISRRWGSQAACIAALIAAEKAAIMAAGGPPYSYDPFAGYPGALTPTATSSMSLADRDLLLLQAISRPPFARPNDLLPGPVALADEAAIDAFLDDLYRARGVIDPPRLAADQPYFGYCADCAGVSAYPNLVTLFSGQALASGSYGLGWSIPYRNGQPLTPAKLAELCPNGVPRRMLEIEGGYVPEGWRVTAWSDNTTPQVRSIVLASSTGNAIVDRLVETGTQGKVVVEAELGYTLTDYNKTAAVVLLDSCEDVNNGALPGRKIVVIDITRQPPGYAEPVEIWVVSITFLPCQNREATAPFYTGFGIHISEYNFEYFDRITYPFAYVPESYADKIASTDSIRPYLDESDCNALRSGSPCAGIQWKFFTEEETGGYGCCERYFGNEG